MRAFALPFLLTSLFLAACGDADSSSTLEQASASAENTIESLTDAMVGNGCDYLPPAVAAAVAGKPAAEAEREPAEGVTLSDGFIGRARAAACSYNWDGQPKLSISAVSEFGSEGAAQASFAEATRTVTREELDQVSGAIREEMGRQAEAGEVSQETVDNADAVGGLFFGDAALQEYTPVPGIGDEAAVQVQVMEVMDMEIPTVTLIARKGRTTFQASAHVVEGGLNYDRERMEEITRELARAVAARID